MLSQTDLDAIHAMSHAISDFNAKLDALIAADTRADEAKAALEAGDVATAKLALGIAPK